MRLHVILAVGISLGLGGTLLHAADGPQRCVTFILDCSASMQYTLQPTDDVQPVSEGGSVSRMTAAKAGLKTALLDLAAGGNHHVGIWLFGHRLTWDDQPDPQLLEQTAYLEQTMDFRVLSTLLPGDDVEAVRAMTRFKPLDLAQLEARFAVVKPWGEGPLYLALVRSLDLFESQPASALHSIVVITDGGNRQGPAAQYPTSKQQVLEAAERRKVPVNVVWLGDMTKDDAGRTEVQEISQLTSGNFAPAYSAADVTEKIRAAFSRQTPAPQQTNDPQTATISDRTAPSAAPVTVEGKISFYEKPVTMATVVLEGLGNGPVKADRSGRFTINDVPPG
ncbi:MAG: VWA domain-containing protein, partial [Planctomycetes bacterium]|nr:VWA domain-containing protein [Planctomycetota bacterium]